MEVFYLNEYSVSGMGGMDWIDLALDKDRSRAFMIRVMNFRFHKIRRIF
jgi:hypothetical protein